MSKYVIVDLEMCNIPKIFKKENFKCKNELIEIGAVLLDESFEVIDSFKTFVSPEYGEIDSFIHKLTGITKEDTAKKFQLYDLKSKNKILYLSCQLKIQIIFLVVYN